MKAPSRAGAAQTGGGDKHPREARGSQASAPPFRHDPSTGCIGHAKRGAWRTFTHASDCPYPRPTVPAAVHIQHAALQEEAIEFRGFQANLARIAGERDTLVVLPTGLGKTVVAVLALADALEGGAERVLLLAPTKPLVEQHAAFFAAVLAPPWNERVQALTGHIGPKDRAAAYQRPGVYCATPQVIENDIVAGRLDLGTFDWIVFDEAHRGVGDYAYTFIAREAAKAKGAGIRRLGLTASPGHDVAKIQEVRDNLGLPHVEVRTPADPDVAPYVQEVKVEWETLPLPETLARISRRLQEALGKRLAPLREGGWLAPGRSRPSRRALLDCAHKLQAQAKSRSDPGPEVFQALSLQAQAMKLVHAIELAETQGAQPLRAFVDKMKREAEGPRPSKATLRLLDDPLVTEAYHIAGHDVHENPKLGRTEGLVRNQLERNPDSLVIVFANYRDTCDAIASHLAVVANARPVVFVGQGKRKGREGLTQKQQQEILQAFREGTHNVLVATSVAEEGLDIPATDLVVFYEPIASEIRAIQRRGRTGRHDEGRVVVLMTKGTQDEAAHWTARRKEQQMVDELRRLRQRLSPGQPEPTAPSSVPASTKAAASQTRLGTAKPDVQVVCDAREQAGGVVRHLHEIGIGVVVRPLDIGDFVASDRIVVERKTTADFVDSLLDGRLFDQLRDLQVYPRPVLVIEGESLHGHRNVSPEALYGALASIAVDYGVSVMQTRDPLETARFIAATAKREQKREGRRVAVRPGRAAMTDAQRLRHIVAGFPLVDEARADALLAHFGDLASVLSATEKALAGVDGIGPGIASELRRLLQAPYRDTETVSRDP